MSPDAPRRLRILHLAFEDPSRPGAGGGSVRNHLINSRIAARHDVTAVVARYPGARSRVRDGVSYRPIGLPLGRFSSVIAYHLAVPFYVLRHPADVVVEDFVAPHSSNLVPLLVNRPTVGLVQYFFSRQKSLEYHLPFWRMEVAGVQSYARLISVSRYIADRVQALNADATVDVIYAGVAAPETGTPDRPARAVAPSLLYLGRLEWEMKGLDSLVEAFARIRESRPDVGLRVAGQGPHEDRLRERFAARGLTDAVTWLGRVEGAAKWQALADADLVLMPSRFETFGLVALEALAVGTPVVAFDIPTLREVGGGGAGVVLADPEDTDALAKTALSILDDPHERARRSAAARTRAAEFDWDQAAREHERAYLDAVAAYRPLSRRQRLGRVRAAVRATLRPRYADGRPVPPPRRSDGAA